MSILEVAQRLGLEYGKKGGGVYARCPLHDDKNPSLHISPEKGRSGLWYCPVCAVGGDAVELFMKVQKVTFPECVKALVG